MNTAHNLAPICGPCNVKKSDTNLHGAGIVSTHPIKASKLHSKVNGYVRSFQVSNTVTKALLAVSTADLTYPGSKSALADLGSIMMQRFSALAPDVLIRYSTSHRIDDPKEDGTLRALVTLDDARRRTKVILEDYYNMDAADVFLDVITAIKSEISDRLEIDISSELQKYGHLYPEVGPPVGRRVIEVDTFTFNKTDAVFTVEGTFDVDMSTEVIVLSENDSGSESFQSDAAAHGRFSASFWPDDADSSSTEVDTPIMTEWKKGPAPW